MLRSAGPVNLESQIRRAERRAELRQRRHRALTIAPLEPGERVIER